MNRCLVIAPYLVNICGLALSRAPITHIWRLVGFMYMYAVGMYVLFVCTDTYILIHIFPLHFKHRAKLILNSFLRNLFYFFKDKLCSKGAERESVRMREEMERY